MKFDSPGQQSRSECSKIHLNFNYMGSSYGAETLTLAEERLNEPTIRSSISSANVECFPYCHECHDCVKQERSNLKEKKNKRPRGQRHMHAHKEPYRTRQHQQQSDEGKERANRVNALSVAQTQGSRVLCPEYNLVTTRESRFGHTKGGLTKGSTMLNCNEQETSERLNAAYTTSGWCQHKVGMRPFLQAPTAGTTRHTRSC